MELGFLGVGTIATAMIRGLRQQWPDLPIHLSPRSEAASRVLAESDGLITRHRSNADVVDASDIVFLMMLPPQLDEAIRGAPFRAGQIVVSCVGGTPLADVEGLVAPATACRVVPLPAIARRDGPLVLYKTSPPVRSLFEGLGDLIDAQDEASFRAYATCSAFMSTYFHVQAALIDEVERNGAPRASAMIYVQSLLRSLAETSVLTRPSDFSTLPLRHETPGGLNERVRTYLERHGWFDEIRAASESIVSLRREDLKKEH